MKPLSAFTRNLEWVIFDTGLSRPTSKILKFRVLFRIPEGLRIPNIYESCFYSQRIKMVLKGLTTKRVFLVDLIDIREIRTKKVSELGRNF